MFQSEAVVDLESCVNLSFDKLASTGTGSFCGWLGNLSAALAHSYAKASECARVYIPLQPTRRAPRSCPGLGLGASTSASSPNGDGSLRVIVLFIFIDS